MGLGEKLMNVRGITSVILMVGCMGMGSIIGMVVLAAIHDGDLTTNVLNNLELVASSAVTAAALLIQHYISSGSQTQQQQQQLQAQTSQPPTAMVPVTVVPASPQAAPAAETATSGVSHAV